MEIPDHHADTVDMAAEDFVSLYAAYADAARTASQALRDHGKNSQQFKDADIASMRLFHRVKKMQGLKKPKSS